MFPSDDYSYEGITAGSTGSSPGEQAQKLIVVSRDQYEIVVRLTDDDRFIDIAELRIKRDFLSTEQRIAASGCFNIEEYYEEE